MPKAVPSALEIFAECNALRVGRVFVASIVLAWAMTWLPHSVPLNAMLILTAALAARAWIRDIPPPSTLETVKRKGRRVGFATGERRSTDAEATRTRNGHLPRPTSVNAPYNVPPPPPVGPRSESWRDHVRSPVVEQSWETLAGSLVQEFIYDTWYACLTPDKEFPAEIRRILNHAFGQLSARARMVDLRAVLQDASELLMEQLELYRDTRENVLADTGSPTAVDFSSGDPALKERALRERMSIDGNLHPAFEQSGGEYKMLRAVSDGLVGLLLDPRDANRVASRAVARELMAACVLRPLMMWSSPYYVNKGMYRMLERHAERRQRRTPEADKIPAPDALRRRELHGTWEFEQRIVKTVQDEATLLVQGGKCECNGMPLQSSLALGLPHGRSRSYDDVHISMATPSSRERMHPVRGGLETNNNNSNNSGGGVAPCSWAPTSNGSHVEDRTSRTSSMSATSPMRSLTQSMHEGREKSAQNESLVSQYETTYTLDGSPFDQNGSFSSPLRVDNVDQHDSFSAAAGHLIARSERKGTRWCECYDDGFIGSPRARVVAADLNTSGAKDFVVYRIRVGDDGGGGREWTASRRYRHFEVLHRQLRSLSGYASKLPPKRIFFHTQNADFVEDRRRALDAFLQEVLQVPQLARSKDLWEFLRSGSERYESLSSFEYRGGVGVDGRQRSGIRRGLSRTMLAGAQSLGRGAVDITQAVTQGVKTGVTEVTSAAVGGVGAVLQEARSSLGLQRVGGGHHHHRRSASFPEGLEEIDHHPQGSTGSLASPTKHAQQARHEGPRQSSSTHSRPVPNELLMLPAATNASAEMIVPTADLVHPTVPSVSASSSASVGLQDYRSSSPNKRSRTISTSQRRPKSRNAGSPAKMRRSPTEELGGVAERSVAFHPSRPNPLLYVAGEEGTLPKGYAYAALDVSGLSDVAGNISEGAIEVDEFGVSSPSGQQASLLASEGQPIPPDSAPPQPTGADLLDLETSAGISAPLYEIVDCLFQLQTRGFFRRQVYAMARQILSLAIGDAIDVFLLSRLRLLSQESTIARIIQHIQSSLWPGGVWIFSRPQYLAAHPATSSGPTSSNRLCNAISQERFLEHTGPKPLDEDEIREAVNQMLLQQAPTALVRLVGRGPYTEGVQDLYEMMQSPVLTRQLGYGMLEIMALHLCPELKELFQKLEHGGL